MKINILVEMKKENPPVLNNFEPQIITIKA